MLTGLRPIFPKNLRAHDLYTNDTGAYGNGVFGRNFQCIEEASEIPLGGRKKEEGTELRYIMLLIATVDHT